MQAAGRMLMLVAVALFVAGGLLYLVGRTGGGFLPGDIVVRRGRFTFAFPIVTSIVASVVLTLILSLVLRRR